MLPQTEANQSNIDHFIDVYSSESHVVFRRQSDNSKGQIKRLQHHQWIPHVRANAASTTPSKQDERATNGNDNKQTSKHINDVLYQRKIQSITLRCNKMYDSKKQYHKKLKNKTVINNNINSNANSNTNNDTNDNSNDNTANNVKDNHHNINVKQQAEIGYQGTGCDGRLHVCVIEIYSHPKCTDESAVGRIAVIDDHLPAVHNHNMIWENRYTATLPTPVKQKGMEYYNKLNLDQKHWLHLMSDYCFNEVRDEIEKETGWRPSNDVCNNVIDFTLSFAVRAMFDLFDIIGCCI